MQGCGNPNLHMLLNYDRLTTPSAFRDTARHEIGHALGLKHTGLQDAVDTGQIPTMHTCSTSSQDRVFTKDEAASAHLQADAAGANAKPVVANHGFETGDFRHYFINGDVQLQGAAASHGSFGARLNAPANWPYVFQSLNYWNTGIATGGNGRLLDAGVWYRTPGSNTTANAVYLATSTRDVKYSSASPCGSANYHIANRALNLARPSGQEAWVLRSILWGNASTSWTFLSHAPGSYIDTKEVAGGASHGNKDGVDVHFYVRAYGNSGLPGVIYADTLEVRDRGAA